ncbi:MAG: ABC transporter ATP-binding protein [Hyphomicrobiaceae bacterium]|nr:ABC transporter ATP-binding protein [Hyphomicrobiaceae bacterium]
MAQVTVDKVSKTYLTDNRSVTALHDVSLDMRDGEFVCVVGHSGCGKTTLLNILAGFLQPSSGEIRVDGVPREKSKASIGVVFQEYALFPWRTALQNVAFGLEMAGESKAAARKRAVEFLELVHLSEFANAYPHQLSGGMRQRVAVARAMAYEPGLLLMDEPFGALDAQTRERLQSLTQEVWLATHKTIFYVTHNISEAVFLGERVVIMRPGPGRIHDIVDIKLPRPRDPLSDEFIDIQRHITRAIMDRDERHG